jgi:transposase
MALGRSGEGAARSSVAGAVLDPSERQLIEQLDCNLLFRRFVGLRMGNPIRHIKVFSKDRQWLLGGEVAKAFFGRVADMTRRKELLNEGHFSVDETLRRRGQARRGFRWNGRNLGGREVWQQM